MRLPDWLVYTVDLTIIVAGLFWAERNAHRSPSQEVEIAVAGVETPGASTPAAAKKLPVARPEKEAIDPQGPLLPDPDPFDERVMVQVGDAEDGIGTAFAINRSGMWLTARHVVDGCMRVGLSVGDGRMVRVDEVRTSHTSDLALLITDRAPAALELNLDRELRIGEDGYHVGFPQGRSGEASSTLQSRSRLVTRGRYAMEEPVLAWAESGRSEGIEGTLSGMSGGPVFDKDGAVIGVIVAESPRRGRIYTATPDSISSFLEAQGLSAPGGEAYPLAASSYIKEADRMRDERAVVKVLCRVSDN
jgi:S1-C subfamily serine protease